MNGKVYLIGAGPGDYKLLTLKACGCLGNADVVVYDRLADDRILGYAPEGAELIYVGKASSQHTMPQEKINQLLKDIERNAYVGIGKSEPLKENLSGFWSRRIDDTHRLVYRISDDVIEIVSCKGHYDD